MKMIITHPNHDDFERMTLIYNKAIEPFYKIYNEEENAVFADDRYESPERLRREAETKDILCLKYENDDLLGYASFRQKDETVVWISSLYIDPALQHFGAGSFLLKAIEEYSETTQLKIIALETHPKAKWAINFYLKNHYHQVNDLLDQEPYHLILNKPPAPNRILLAKIIN